LGNGDFCPLKDTDILIVGAGPAGIFAALEMLHRRPGRRITIAEKGKSLAERRCPKEKTGVCVHCKPYCHISSGFSGAGAFSDGKLSLSCDVGGDLPDLIGKTQAQELIDYTDSIYLRYGASQKVEGVSDPEKIREIRRRAIQAGLKLVDCPIRHLGTEKAQELYGKIQSDLEDAGVQLLFGCECEDILAEHNRCAGAVLRNVASSERFEVRSKNTVIAAGRSGAGWLGGICDRHAIAHEPGTVDIGVRVEVRNEIMEEVNNVLYESKLVGYPPPFRNKVRTFCQNPGGYVSQENYDDGGLAVVNGHSYKDRKSSNTNLAVLCSHHFQTPFNQPILYAQKIAQLANMLEDGRILVQRLGDILEGKRTWPDELSLSNVQPTLPDAAAGDITAAMPYRTMVSILGFIQAVDKVVPGFASEETLLYSPEIKLYSNRVTMDRNLQTNVGSLYCLGDASGWTRGLMMASAMGVLAARVVD